MMMDPLLETSSLRKWECVICLEPLCSKNSKQSVGRCTHIFHTSCIDEWTKNNQNCPQCRLEWSFVLITEASEDDEILTKITRKFLTLNHAAQTKIEERDGQLAELRKEIDRLSRKVIIETKRAEELEKELQKIKKERQKKLLGDPLEDLTVVQLQKIANDISRSSHLDGNLQTFVRALRSENEKEQHDEEANKLWSYVVHKKYEKDLVLQILKICSQRYGTTLQQLERVCNYLRISVNFSSYRNSSC